MNKDFDIERFLSLEGYDNEKRKARRKGSGGSQEFFTPYSIVKKMCDKVSEEEWNDTEKTFLEPCFGSGQFVIYIVYNRIMHDVEPMQALKTLWGVELMPDNVAETKNRILSLLDNMEVEYDKKEAKKIMDKHLVCSDFFLWNFNEWRPYTEKELKENLKKNKKKSA